MSARAPMDPAKSRAGERDLEITGIDFRRGPNGEGRLLVSFSGDGAAADLRREGDRLFLEVFNATLPPEQSQRIDVVVGAFVVDVVDVVLDESIGPDEVTLVDVDSVPVLDPSELQKLVGGSPVLASPPCSEVLNVKLDDVKHLIL